MTTLRVYYGDGTHADLTVSKGKVTISAKPGTGLVFSWWTATCGLQNSNASTTTAYVYVDAAGEYATEVDVTQTFTLNYSAGAGGSISGNAHQTVNYGKTGSAVTAVPNNGYHFVQWSDGDTHTSRQDGPAYGNYNISASFARNPANPSWTLTVNSGSGGGSYYANSTVTIVANAAPGGYHFAYWSGDIAGIADIYSATTTIYTQSSDATVTANYASNSAGPWTVAYIAGEHGTISGDTAQIIANGGDTTEVTAVPDDGYAFAGWDDNVQTPDRYDTDITENMRITANFVLIPVVYQEYPKVVLF